MEHRWNEIDRGKPKYSGKNLSQYHFVHQKSHMDWPGIEPGPPRWEACFRITCQVKFRILCNSVFYINYEQDCCIRHGGCYTTSYDWLSGRQITLIIDVRYVRPSVVLMQLTDLDHWKNWDRRFEFSLKDGFIPVVVLTCLGRGLTLAQLSC
jgi:hypothetical protein